MGNAPFPGYTAIELRSADFSPPRSSPAKTAGSGLKSALLSCRNSLNSMAVLPDPHSSIVGRGNRPRAWWWYQDAPRGHLEMVYENALAHRLRKARFEMRKFAWSQDAARRKSKPAFLLSAVS